MSSRVEGGYIEDSGQERYAMLKEEKEKEEKKKKREREMTDPGEGFVYIAATTGLACFAVLGMPRLGIYTSSYIFVFLYTPI